MRTRLRFRSPGFGTDFSTFGLRHRRDIGELDAAVGGVEFEGGPGWDETGEVFAAGLPAHRDRYDVVFFFERD